MKQLGASVKRRVLRDFVAGSEDCGCCTASEELYFTRKAHSSWKMH